MASQCCCVSVNPSTSRFFAPDGFSTSSCRSRNLWVIQGRILCGIRSVDMNSLRFDAELWETGCSFDSVVLVLILWFAFTCSVSCVLPGEGLQLERLSQPSFSSSPRRLVQCVSSTFASPSDNGDERQRRSVASDVLVKASEPIRAFPWARAGNVILRRLLDQFWTIGKWLAIPVLAVSVLSELSYTLLQERVLVIPIGMIFGIVFAGIMRETALELSPSIEEGRIPWHLVALGFWFVALKLISPYLPIWGRISVPHFANGGLWQVIAYVNDWRKNHAERETVK